MGFTTTLPIGVLLQLSPIARGPIQHLAFYCATLSLAASIATAFLVLETGRRGSDLLARRPRLVTFGHLSALLPGVVAAIILSLALTMRLIYVSIEVLRGYPVPEPHYFGFGIGGLWSLGLLLASNTVSLVSTRDQRLATCLLWTGVMTALWACLLLPSFRITATGGFERTGATLWLLTSLSITLTAAVVLSGWFWRTHGTPAANLGTDSVMTQAPPGLATSCSVLAMIVGLVVCYHLLVPIRAVGGSFHGAGLIATGSAGLTAYACLLLLRREYNGNLADAAAGLVSLGFCGLSTLFVPSSVTVLVDRYPMLFNAMIVGLACATALWTWLSEVWRQQPDRGIASVPVGRLIHHAKRFAFLSAALALVADIMMIFWPRLPGIATMDHSFGRVTAGFAANLFLLLVMLWCSRRLRRMTFHLLTIMAVLATAGFLAMRMIPFASRTG